MDEELKTEVEEILENARAAYRAGEITLEQMQDAIRIPLMDLYMSELGGTWQSRGFCRFPSFLWEAQFFCYEQMSLPI